MTMLLVSTLILYTFIGAFSLSRGFFSFAFNAWFFVVFSATNFGENAILLNLTIKTFQGGLKRFVIADFDFRHQGFPPLVACIQNIEILSNSYTSWICGEIISQPHVLCQDFSLALLLVSQTLT